MVSAEKAFYWIMPPRTSAERSGRNEVISVATSTAAAVTAVFTMTTPPEGDCMVTFEALTEDCYVRFKTANSAAATTTANGIVIPKGSQANFWLSPLTDKYVDHIAAGTGKLKWYVSSPVYEHYKLAGT